MAASFPGLPSPSCMCKVTAGSQCDCGVRPPWSDGLRHAIPTTEQMAGMAQLGSRSCGVRSTDRMACCHEADTSCRDRAGGATNQAPMSPSQLFPEAVLPQGDTDADRQGHEERAQQGSAFLHTRTLAVCIFLLGVLTSARAPCWSVAIGPQHSSPAGAPPSVSPQLRRPHTLAARGTNVHCAPVRTESHDHM